MSEPVTTYAVRRFSPYQGVWHILKCAQGRAVTANGIDWQIQPRLAVKARGWGSLDKPKAEFRYYVFGTWSRKDSLQRSPLNPDVNTAAAIESGDHLVGLLEQHAGSLPFTLTDKYELWLLDQHSGMPVLCLRSCIDASQISTNMALDWMPFHAARQDTSFLQELLQLGGLSMSVSEILTGLKKLIRQRCGVSPVAQWFRRSDDAGGEGLVSLHGFRENTGTRLDRQYFPGTLLHRQWENEEDQLLVDSYLQWQAPALLHLPELTEEERDWLEDAACFQAIELSRHASVYPTVIDQDRINAALVQAKIRMANEGLA